MKAAAWFTGGVITTVGAAAVVALLWWLTGADYDKQAVS